MTGSIAVSRTTRGFSNASRKRERAFRPDEECVSRTCNVSRRLTIAHGDLRSGDVLLAL
jgi:hypothetical protein